MHAAFDSYIGIDYSGAETADSRLKGLQVYAAHPFHEPVRVSPPTSRRHWSRRDVAQWLLGEIQSGKPLLIGIDHGFSFPESYFNRYRLDSWPTFLADFCRHWPTDRPGWSVDAVRKGTAWPPGEKSREERIGNPSELRLCERWTSSAKSVFRFDVQGSVAKSTHAGLPWLQYLRAQAGAHLFFWPFDGWQPPEGKSVIAEVYPSIFRNRYPRDARTTDEQDAYAVARWLEEAGRHGSLYRYFAPPLTLAERRVAEIEGWILGIA
jgi:hypothetical protein